MHTDFTGYRLQRLQPSLHSVLYVDAAVYVSTTAVVVLLYSTTNANTHIMYKHTFQPALFSTITQQLFKSLKLRHSMGSVSRARKTKLLLDAAASVHV